MKKKLVLLWEILIIHLAVHYLVISKLLARKWRKRLLAKIATEAKLRGQIKTPLLLLSSMNNKRLTDIKKINNLNFCQAILSHNFSKPKISIDAVNNSHSILLVVHNSAPYDNAGYALRTLHEAKAYQALGYQVTIVTRLGYPWDLAKHRELPFQTSRWVDGIEILAIGGTRQYKIDSDLKYAVQYGQKVAEIISERNIGLIQASSNYINGFAAYFASRKTGVPYIYEARGMWHVTAASANPTFRQSERFNYEDRMEQLVLNHASANIFISDILKKRYYQNKEIPALIIKNCINDLSENAIIHKNYQKENPFKLVYVGSLVYYEGLVSLIDVVAGLENKNIQLDIYGSGPHQAAVERKLAQVKALNVFFHGRVPSEQVAGIYRNAHGVVVPRVDCEVTQMVPPLKPIEAIWHGLPVIVSELPAIVELMQGLNALLYAKPDDASALKKQILSLRDDYQRYVSYVPSDIEYIRNHRSWNKEMAQITELITTKS